MKELLEKISSYNIFNYLLPGVVFAALAKSVTSYDFIQKDIAVGVFVYYFIGLIISRVGSLILEPSLKRMSYVKFAPYEDYIVASKKDPKLEILSEANNSYRTISALFILLALLKLYELLAGRYSILETFTPWLLLAALLVLFISSYKKQTEYITKRISVGKG